MPNQHSAYEGKYFYYTIETNNTRGWRICWNTHPLLINNLDKVRVESWQEIPEELAEHLIDKYGSVETCYECGHISGTNVMNCAKCSSSTL